MSVRTKKRPTKKRKTISTSKRKTIPWREAAKKDLIKHSESGQMLRGARFKADISQKALAEEIGISQHHISEMENGKRPIGKEMAKRFAKFFDIDYRLFL